MNFSKLEQYFDALPMRGIPACELVVTHKGKEVFHKTAGEVDPARDIYYVCSISKITTCVAAMRLYEEGKLGLDDPVYKYLPAYKNMKVLQKDGSVAPAQNTMTVRHIFTMTGGLDYNLFSDPVNQLLEKNPHASTVDIASAFAERPLLFEPGTHFRYSLCHDVLAAVVEVASGKRFADYVKEIILDPLGMCDTDFHLTEKLLPRMARQYKYVHGLFESREVTPYNKYIPTDMYDSGGAGLCTTVNDQVKLMKVLAHRGLAENGYRLLKEETIAMMQTDQLSDSAKEDFSPNARWGYSFGLCGRVHMRPEISLALSPAGEFGWDGATGPYALIDAKNDISIFYCMHIYGCAYAYRSIHPMLRDLAYQGIFED